MKKTVILLSLVASGILVKAQTNPAISSWLQNTNGTKGRHYVNGNFTPINDNDSVNVQTVLYSATWA